MLTLYQRYAVAETVHSLQRRLGIYPKTCTQNLWFTYTDARTHTHTHTNTHTYTHTHTRTHAGTLAHTHTHTHTNAHSSSRPCVRFKSLREVSGCGKWGLSIDIASAAWSIKVCLVVGQWFDRPSRRCDVSAQTPLASSPDLS